jgi:cytoskeletal protein RodZ
LKRCPECNSSFSDAAQFCELDGTPLVAVVPVDRTGAVHPTSSRSLLPIGVLAGILIGVLLVLVYFAVSRQTTSEISNTSDSNSNVRQQEFPQPQQPAPLVTASPSVEPSVEPSPSPSIETPSPQSNSAQVKLSGTDPISTAAGASEPVVIRLHSGITIEAEAAWQTAEGIWYRERGVVSLLDPKNVKAIEKPAPAKPQPSASTATPSP